MCIIQSVTTKRPDTRLYTLAGRVNTSARCVLPPCAKLSFPSTPVSKLQSHESRGTSQECSNMGEGVKLKRHTDLYCIQKENPHIINKSIWLCS